MAKHREKIVSKKVRDQIYSKCKRNIDLTDLEIDNAKIMVKELKENAIKSKQLAENPKSYSNLVKTSTTTLKEDEFRESNLRMSKIEDTLANHLEECISKSKRKGT